MIISASKIHHSKCKEQSMSAAPRLFNNPRSQVGTDIQHFKTDNKQPKINMTGHRERIEETGKCILIAPHLVFVFLNSGWST